MPAKRRGFRYLLGDSRREAKRLNEQAKLWDPTALALFDRIGVKPGWKVLEVGPGQGSLNLELRRRVRGPVDIVERSMTFAKRLERLSARDGFGTGRIWRTDLIDAPLPRGEYDLIFARWVFLFLPKTEAHVRKLVSALKPGGLLAIEDYHRETFAMIPLPPEWNDMMAADRAFFASQGGDWSVAGKLPDMYRRAGLSLVEITPTIRTGGPRSPVWRWITKYFFGVFDRYAKIPPFSPAQATTLRRRWRAAERDPASLLIAPAVLDVVGRKPRRSNR